MIMITKIFHQHQGKLIELLTEIHNKDKIKI